MDSLKIRNVPKLKLKYEVRTHPELPHVVKFSGGRTSGMMLFVLLESGILKADRGDVVVFNNTTTEHPSTYDFARRCKELVEEKYGIPFYWVEYQTYEDARGGEWTRLPSYRLVKSVPRSDENPDGFQWRGEAFEELLSFRGFVPNFFHRTCTSHLKLETTRSFLKNWFAGKPEIERLGHFGDSSRIDKDDLYERHCRNNGKVPKDIFLTKKAFVCSRPVSRPAQQFADFSNAYGPFKNSYFDKKRLGNKVHLGEEGVEYLAFVGLRSDEMRRVVKVRRRNSGGPHALGYEGEHVYMPLSDTGITAEGIEAFWKKQDWNLELNSQDGLSNCTYCFLKGLKGLQRVHTILGTNFDQSLKDSPCDLRWWIGLEKKYGRDLKAEGREIRGNMPNNFIGFFDPKTGFKYEHLEVRTDSKDLSRYEDSILPCDCTD